MSSDQDMSNQTTTSLRKAEQAVVNGIYAGIAWLLLDFGLLVKEHGAQTITAFAARPEMVVGSVIVIACVAGLFYKSRTAASILFMLFLIPLVLRAVQGAFPPAMMMIFSLVLLYFFLAAVLGTFKYHALIDVKREASRSD